MNKRQRALKAIKMEEVDRIPTSYRGLKNVTLSLMRYLGLKENDDFVGIKDEFLSRLSADYWGMGHNICFFSTFHARYNGPAPPEPYIQDGYNVPCARHTGYLQAC